jgi:hypothetical protein
MSVITTGLNPKALWPGIKAWYGRTYDEFDVQYTDLFETETSDKAYEEVVESVGFGLAVVKPQGQAITYDSDHQGSVNRFTHVGYGLGFIITHEEYRDNLYMDVAKRRSPDLAFSMRQTKENIAANVYNRAFNTSTLRRRQGDVRHRPSERHRQPVEPAHHRRGFVGSVPGRHVHPDQQRDRLARPKDLAEAQEPASSRPRSQFEAYRILKSINQNDTANNAINALRASGAFPTASRSTTTSPTPMRGSFARSSVGRS